MKSKELFRKIEQGQIGNCYFFSGEEGYLKEKALHEIKEKLIPEGMENLNYQLSYASDVEIDSFINLLETFPFLSEKRLVVLKEIERLTKANFEKICEYLQKPNSTTCLVLVASGKVSPKKEYYKRIVKFTEWVDFWPLYENEVPGWIQEEVEKRGKGIKKSTAQLLQSEVGNNLFDLSGEINKLEIYVGARKIISDDDVMGLVGRRKGNTVFDLLDAIDKRATPLALEIMTHLFEEGKDPIRILGMIIKRFRQFLLGRALLEKNYSPAKILETLQLNPYYNRNFIHYLENFSIRDLVKKFARLFKADVDIKRGKMPPKLALELLTVELCGGMRTRG